MIHWNECEVVSHTFVIEIQGCNWGVSESTIVHILSIRLSTWSVTSEATLIG
jgi:hypothetical protein